MSDNPQPRDRGRPVGSRDSYKRKAPVTRAVEQHLAEIMKLLAEMNRRHRNEHESLPAVLRWLTDIERQLGLVEKPAAPKSSRRQPLGVLIK